MPLTFIADFEIQLVRICRICP